MDRGSDENIANQSSYTPNRSATLNSRIVLSLPNDSDTVSDKVWQINFHLYQKEHQLQPVE